MRILGMALMLSLLAHAQQAKAPGRFQPDPKLPPELGVPYVVITTDALAPSFQRLVEWKRSTGMPAQIVTIEWLSKNPFYAGADVAERMYALLKDLRQNWKTRWVLLGGDTDLVPTQRVRAYQGEHGGDQLACDVFFSDVLPADATDPDAVTSYGWNGDGDRFMGEVGKDGFDMAPELYVGRIPVETPKEAETFFEKYFEYVDATDKDVAWLNRSLVVSANQFKNQQEKLVELLKELGGRDYVVKLLAEEKPDPIKPIVDELQTGYALFDFFGHGCPSHFWATDDRTSFRMDHVKQLKNTGKYPIVFGNSCNTLEFERDDCFGESWLLQPKGGGIAYMGYTSVSFQSPVNYDIYRLLFGGDCPQLGRAFTEAKVKFKQDEWVGEILGLLGDPEMWVRTAAPRKLAVKDEHFAMNAPSRVTVTDADGKPLKSARVLLDAPGVYCVATSDADGVARLGQPGKGGSARLSVLAQNGHRFDKKVTIDGKAVGIARPTMGIDAKELRPGAEAKLNFAWAQPVAKGTLTLSFEDDRFVKCEAASQEFEGTSASFAMKIDPRVPCGHQVWATLKYGEWSWTFRAPVEGASVSLGACTVDDVDGNNDKRVGWEDAGKRIRFTVGLFNGGTQPSTGLKLSITTADPAVTLTKGSITFGTLGLQDLVQPKDRPFEFQLAADYDGHAIEFVLSMEDDGKNRWTAKMLFTVPPAPPLLVRGESRLKSAVLSWTPGGSAGVIGYHVYRATSEKGNYERVTELPVRNATRYPDSGLKPATAYWYVVRAVTADGLESRGSIPVRAHTLTPLPKGAEKPAGER